VGAPLEQFRFKEDEPPSDIAPSAVEGLTQGFQVVEVNEPAGDGATHYDLGVAYKEMELYDEAIQEFQLSEADPGRALASAEMLAACHLAKGRPDAAVQALLKGLETAADGPDAARARFALGGAYEALGQPEQALAQYDRLESEGAAIPGLPQRVAALRARGVTGRAPAAPVPEARRSPEVPAAAPVSAPEPVAPAAPPPATADAARARRKKISFI
jgi:TolA-binding protein